MPGPKQNVTHRTDATALDVIKRRHVVGRFLLTLYSERGIGPQRAPSSFPRYRTRGAFVTHIHTQLIPFS